MSIIFSSKMDNSIKLFKSIGADFNEINGFLNGPSEGLESHKVVDRVKSIVFNKLLDLSMERKESDPVLTDKPGGGVHISYKWKHNPLTPDEEALLQIQANTLVQHAFEGRGLNSRPLNLSKCNFARLEVTTAQEIVRIAVEMGKIFKRVQALQENNRAPSPVSVASMSPFEEYESCKDAHKLVQKHISYLPSSGLGEMVRDQRDLLNGQAQVLFEKMQSLEKTLHISKLEIMPYEGIQFKEEFLQLFERLNKLQEYPYRDQNKLKEALAECERYLAALQSRYRTQLTEKQEIFNEKVLVITNKIAEICEENHLPRIRSSKEIIKGDDYIAASYPPHFNTSISKFL